MPRYYLGESNYKPEYCDMLIEHMAKGLSFKSFAAIVNVTEKCLGDWTKKFPEFKEAEAIGHEKMRLVYEQWGIDGMLNKVKYFNDRIWRLNMISRFRSEWSDSVTQNQNHSGEIKKEIVVKFENNSNATEPSQSTEGDFREQ